MLGAPVVLGLAMLVSALAGAPIDSGLAPEFMTSIDKDAIRRVVLAHRDEVRGCYEAALTRDPNTEGRVVISFVVITTGDVESSEVMVNTTDDFRLGECIAKVSESWQFPDLAGLGRRVINYPFLLQRY